MCIRFSKGRTIYKAEEALRAGVDERSIQRDIDALRQFLEDRRSSDGNECRSIVYDYSRKGFVMVGEEASEMSNSGILAVSKILLESRAFSKDEMYGILNKMVEGCAPSKNRKLVQELIANERYHYVELHHQSLIEDKLWYFGENIRDCNMLRIAYTKAGAEGELVDRVIEPVAILFSEYYFYLNAYIMEKDGDEYVRKYDYPAIFRLDRIREYEQTGLKFQIPYADRFQEGDFRKRIQFMYAGELMKSRNHNICI